MAVERFETANSVYEIDQDEKRVRRVSGVNPPTSRQGEDGDWREYQRVVPYGDSGCLLIMWDSQRGTITSPLSTDLDLRVTR